MFTIEYYSAKPRISLLFATKWVKMKGIILTEISQAQKDKYHRFFFICGNFKKLI
jgi:hypothetical protein